MNRTLSIIISAVIASPLACWYFPVQAADKPPGSGPDLKGGLRVVLQAQEKLGEPITDDTIQKALGILRDRVDSLGVRETSLYPQGNDRVVIEIAGEDDPEAAVDILKNVAQLEFQDEQGNVLVSGKNLTDAQARFNPNTQEAYVELKFDKEGADLFAQATTANVGKPLVIVLDGKPISSPIVRQPITDGNAVIEGSFDTKEAQDLAVLQAWALLISFNVLEKRSIGPSLGADSLEKSLRAGVIGILAVLLFMLGYYRLPGLIADISIVLYGLLVMGSMVLLDAVLTLPGIAAFVLSIGMAVDANIIIYERIKEEIRWGKTLQAAIDAGFKRAFWTIFDANLTTLVAALVLMYFGTGTVKGFAIILSIGLVINMFTALTFTRYLLGLASNVTKNTRLYGV